MPAAAQRSRLREASLAAPLGGMNTISSGIDMPITDSIYAYNLIGAEYGLRSRLGWREWVTGLDGPVRSLLPFKGSVKAGSNDRLFACTQTGIWDVSSSTDVPTQVLVFGTQDADSGFGVSCVFVNTAGNHFLCYCDESNGYITYAESGALWTVGGISGSAISGATAANLAFVMPWKNRLWFVERETAKAWYSDVGAVSGALTAFNFGGRFKAGGELRGLWSWTFDGGSGIDDKLVGVSGGGDVVIYEGTDPSSASTFGLSGVWSVGSVPLGRNLCTDNGGELLVMSSTGILPLRQLTNGQSTAAQYSTFKVGNLFNQMQAATAGVRGWSMRIHPADASLMVLVPTAADQPCQQLVMSLISKGWSQYRDMPMGLCAEPWNGTLYFGTPDGRVCQNTGYLDGVTLADPSAFTPIQWSLLTAFSSLGSPAQKQVAVIHANVLAQGGSSSHQVEARYDLDLAEIYTLSASATAPGDLWDSATWDAAVWAGAYRVQSSVFGAAGCGALVALAARGTTSSRMTLPGFSLAYETSRGMLG